MYLCIGCWDFLLKGVRKISKTKDRQTTYNDLNTNITAAKGDLELISMHVWSLELKQNIIISMNIFANKAFKSRNEVTYFWRIIKSTNNSFSLQT